MDGSASHDRDDAGRGGEPEHHVRVHVHVALASIFLTFLAPVVAVQNLRDTEAASSGSIDPLLLFVGYFPNSVHLTRVTELLTLDVNLLGQTSTALLWHFSGYVWSSGRSEEAPPGDSEADGQ